MSASFKLFFTSLFLFFTSLFLRITLHSTRSVFDPSQFAGLPLNVMALMPVLVHHFEQPTEFCIKVVSEIQQVTLT